MAEGDFSWIKFAKLSGLTIGLLVYELVCFIGFLSLSIGAQAGITILIKTAVNYDLHVAWQSFIGWYILALSTQVHLRFYRKCIYPKIRRSVRANRTLLQGLPRVIYFVVFCFCIYGVVHEYEATHGYPPSPDKLRSKAPVTNDTSNLSSHFSLLGRGLTVKKTHTVYAQSDFEPVAPDHRLHTFLFLTEMSYLIYASSQVLTIFLLRLMRDIPPFPLIPQMYASFSMTILQAILTVFYCFPLVMTLVACHMFHVEALSTYMLTLCLALSVAMAASQLESETPFPTQPKVGPYYYFEGNHRARINLVLGFLPPISYYFFRDHKSYPLSAQDMNFTMFTFWVMSALMHTVKSLYMTTWRPVQANPPPHAQQVLDPDRMLPQPRAQNLQPQLEEPVVTVTLAPDGELQRVVVVDDEQNPGVKTTDDDEVNADPLRRKGSRRSKSKRRKPEGGGASSGPGNGTNEASYSGYVDEAKAVYTLQPGMNSDISDNEAKLSSNSKPENKMQEGVEFAGTNAMELDNANVEIVQGNCKSDGMHVHTPDEETCGSPFKHSESDCVNENTGNGVNLDSHGAEVKKDLESCKEPGSKIETTDVVHV